MRLTVYLNAEVDDQYASRKRKEYRSARVELSIGACAGVADGSGRACHGASPPPVLLEVGVHVVG